MREIKFRVWDKSFGETGKSRMLNWELYEKPVHFWENYYRFPGRILMQYTGLKDKNGVEIYEGDVIEAKLDGRYLSRTSWKGEPDIVGEVFWDYGGFRLKFKGDKDSRYGDFYDFIEDARDDFLMMEETESEIIGNIYENPELLNNN